MKRAISLTIIAICWLHWGGMEAMAQTPARTGLKPALQRGLGQLKTYGRIAVVDNYRGSRSDLQHYAFFRTRVGRPAAAGLAAAKTAFTATMATGILGLGYLTYKPLVNLGRRLTGKRPLTFGELLSGAQYRETESAASVPAPAEVR